MCTMGIVVFVVYAERYRQQSEAMGCDALCEPVFGHSSMLVRHCTRHVNECQDVFISFSPMWQIHLSQNVFLNVLMN